MRPAGWCLLAVLCLVWPAAAVRGRAEGAGEPPPRVTLTLNGESVPEALALLFRAAGAKYRLRPPTPRPPAVKKAP